MFIFLRLYSLVFCLLMLVSCGKNSANNQTDKEAKSFSLEIADSIMIAYLGDMELIDYDEQNGKYLLADNSLWKYLEVTDQGEILNENQLSSDGINAVPNLSGLGYLDGDVVVFTQTDGYYRFQGSTKVGEIAIPYAYRSVVVYDKLGIFSEGNRIYYQKPWPQTINLSMNDWSFFSQLYELPIIESLDVVSGDTLSAVRLPESSAFLDGRVHGMLLPTYSLVDDLLLLSMRLRPEIYIYQKNGNAFKYLKTIDVDIPGWVSYDPVEKERAAHIYEGMMSKQIGVLTSLLHVNDYYLAVYSKGIPEEKMPASKGDHLADALRKRKANPFFAAIFDKDFNQLATNVPFPGTSNYPMVVNNEGELVVSKVAGLSETEDDGIILYKLKLKQK